MRKVVWQMVFTLDGFMAGPQGELDWNVTDSEFLQYAAEMPKQIDMLMFGRVTYDLMASFWPKAIEPIAGLMNNFPKLVFSRTLKQAAWKIPVSRSGASPRGSRS